MTGRPGRGATSRRASIPANYVTVFGSFPTANVSIAPGLSSPVTKEFTVSAGTQLGSEGFDAGHLCAAATWATSSRTSSTSPMARRTWSQDGVDFGTFTNIQFRNSSVPKRDYQAMVFQADFRLRPNWQVAGNYTLQLENDGTFTGEAQNQPGTSSAYGDFPVAGLPTIYTRGVPDGHLYDFQRSKLRAVDDLLDGPAGRRPAVALRSAACRFGPDLQSRRVERRPQRHPDWACSTPPGIRTRPRRRTCTSAIADRSSSRASRSSTRRSTTSSRSTRPRVRG